MNPLKAKYLLCLVLFLIAGLSNIKAQAVLNADGPGNTYELINSILAPGATAVESPDTFHPAFGRHITEVWDADLGKYVFEFNIHISDPNELQDISTGDTDRQRLEIKTYAPSPDSLKGTCGETMVFKWQFRIPVGFQPSLNFTHIHQVKAVDGDDANPLFVLTPRYNASGNKLELNYYDGNNVLTKEANVNLAPFEGTWVEATETIRVDSIHGRYAISIKKVSDGTVLLSWSNNDLCTIRSTNSFIRPKWGIYRSIASISYLRDETMRFNGFSIQELKNQAQTITFSALPTVNTGIANFAPGASSSSGLKVTYTSSNPLVATIVNDSVHIVGAGSTIITAHQTGSPTFVAAADVSQPLTVIPADVVLMDELFNYSVANLANESSWTTAYTTAIGSGAGRTLVASPLTYSNAGGTYVLSGNGKTMNCDYASGASDYKNYKAFTTTPVSTGAVYLSFLYKAGLSQTQSQSEVFGLASGTNAGAKVWVGKGAVSTSNYRFGTTRGSTTSTDIKWGTTEFSDVNAVILVVLKYDFSTQTSSVFLNPVVASASEPTAEVIDNSTATIRTSLNNLWFRLTGSSIARYNISGVRVSTSWAAAVASGMPTDLQWQHKTSAFVLKYGQLQLPEAAEVKIFNLQGKQLIDTRASNSVSLNLSSGLYMLHFRSVSGTVIHQKLYIP